MDSVDTILEDSINPLGVLRPQHSAETQRDLLPPT